MRKLQTLIIVALCLCLAGTSAFAGKSLTVKRLADTVADPMGMEITRQDCQVGNLNTPSWAIGDWIYGLEGYKLLFDPGLTCSCPVGFHLESVHMLMQFGAEDVPSTFDVLVDLEEAVWNAAIGCYYPGPELCVSQVYSITIDTAGLYDIAIPIFDECECAAMGYHYLLSFHILTEFDPAMRPDAVSDDLPTTCTSWNDFGSGWFDLVGDFGWPGNVIMWGDVVCCEFPVGTQDDTWGGLKNLYWL